MPLSAIEPIDADFEAELGRHFADGRAAWAIIKTGARKAAAKRLLADNSAERKRLSEVLSDLPHEDFIAELKRYDRLKAECDELRRIAYPSAFPEVQRG